MDESSSEANAQNEPLEAQTVPRLPNFAPPPPFLGDTTPLFG